MKRYSFAAVFLGSILLLILTHQARTAELPSLPDHSTTTGSANCRLDSLSALEQIGPLPLKGTTPNSRVSTGLPNQSPSSLAMTNEDATNPELTSAASVNGATNFNNSVSTFSPKSPTAITWHIEEVDSKSTGRSSLVLDNDEYPHISYEASRPELGRYDLKYARWMGSQWDLDIVGDMESGGRTSLALDNSGHPHISYSACHPFGCYRRYAEWTGTGWSIANDMDGQGPLVIDTHGDPHIAYRYGNVVGELSLRYAYRTGSSWITSTVDNGSGDFGSASLKLDSSQYPHIAYYGDFQLKYARWTGSDWDIQVADDSATYVGMYPSLALDDNDRPHISYYDWNDANLKYATWIGTSWISQTVDSNGEVGLYTSLALDGSGHPHIGYLDGTNWTVRYTRWTGTEWLCETVDTGILDYEPIWLVLDSKNQPHISYTNGNGVMYGWGETAPTSFSISGRVSDGGNEAVEGAVISTNAGVGAATNASGYYTLTGLITGTYTLTPTKSGWTFAPTQRTVSVPPDVIGQDFTGSDRSSVYLPLVIRGN